MFTTCTAVVKKIPEETRNHLASYLQRHLREAQAYVGSALFVPTTSNYFTTWLFLAAKYSTL
jgi:hypothetical protein